jgi:hypothetical protein
MIAASAANVAKIRVLIVFRLSKGSCSFAPDAAQALSAIDFASVP